MPLHIQDVEHEPGERGCVGARCPGEGFIRQPAKQGGEVEMAIVRRAKHRADDRRKVARWFVLVHEHIIAGPT